MEKQRVFGLSQNQLKIVAAISMLVDHIGVELFPQMIILRIIGRIAFLIFCFYIYEGCQYTHNRTKYLARIFGLGVLCLLGYYFYSGIIYGNVLITFSLSICVLYSIQFFEQCWHKADAKSRFAGGFIVAACVGGVFVICRLIDVDYGFCGVILPVFPAILTSLLKGRKLTDQYMYWLKLLGFGVGLIILSYQMGGIQYFSLLSVAFLLAYNGDRGKLRMKYFFYWFYPVHLIVIGMISMVIN